jgi:DnaD/phage-associated family protein
MLQGSKKLIDEYPLLVLPSLAKEIGLNEAIVIQQIHFWMQQSRHKKDGRIWIYNTVKDWEQQFPFWSESTIKRILNKLYKEGFIVKGNYNKANYDKTIWYSIDYEKLGYVTKGSGQNELNEPKGSGQVDTIVRSDCTNRMGQNEPTYTRDYTETNLQRKEEEDALLVYEKNIGIIPPIVRDQLIQWCEELTDAVVIEAIGEAVSHGAFNFTYVNKILADWDKANLKDIDSVHSYQLSKSNRNKTIQFKPRQQQKEEPVKQYNYGF